MTLPRSGGARFGRAAAVALCGLGLGGAAGCGSRAAPPAPPPAPAAAAPDRVRPTTWVEGGPSFLPNLGLEVGVGRTVSHGSGATLSLDLHGAWQVLDDEDFADDGNPKAGPWYQVRGGVRRSSSPDGLRHFVTRIGAVWVRAEGRPNIIQDGGDYLGAYGGVGFQTDLTPTFSVGPELTVLGITRTTKLSVARPVPQVNWHARIRWPAADTDGAERAPPPRGELYGALSAVALPGVGGGILLGQVFRRRATATWSVEVAAAKQLPRRRLLFDGDGQWAQVQVGVGARLAPGGRGHWTGHGGAVWLRSTAANPFLDVQADHIGVYAGVGYEYDLTETLATGPHLNLMVVSYEQDVAFRLVPQLRWSVLVRP